MGTMTSEWLYPAIGFLLGLHLAIMYYSLRRRQQQESTAPNAQADSEAGENGVVCPSCGESNDPTFRYCRTCVTELPAAVGPVPRGSKRSGRTI